MQTNNKRIAKNTLFLYMRMGISMLVSLYTSRIVLQALGVEDYGIYNSVAGIVSMLAFFNSSLNTATQRYLSVELGKGNYDRLNRVFSMSFLAYAVLALFVVLIAETVGLWFVKTQMVIPESRLSIAIWVYHFSIFSFTISLLYVPYSASIIAHERMSIYAYLSIFDVILKLLLVLLLTKLRYDKLWMYSLMTMVIMPSLYFFLNRAICKRLFSECYISTIFDKDLFKGLFSFSGWMVAGTVTHMLSTQGVNILVNIFFGPLMNAARGIAMQVYGAVSSFSMNFMTAIRPPIMKSYAQGDHQYMYSLTFSASRFTTYFLLILVLPIILNTYEVLSLWLGQVPEHSVLFCQLVLFDLLITQSYNPIAYVNQATGDIKIYQLVISFGFVLIFGITWLLYVLGLFAEICLVVAIIIDLIGLFVRLWVMKRSVSFPVHEYLKTVTLPVCIVIAISFVFSRLLLSFIAADSIIFVLLRIIVCVVITFAIAWIIGMKSSEKRFVLQHAKKMIHR